MNKFSKFDQILVNSCFIPIGYRCWTKNPLKKYNLVSQSLPFDAGFFSPQSIVNILQTNDMSLLLKKNNDPKNFCFVKKEYFTDGRYLTKKDDKKVVFEKDGECFVSISEETIDEDFGKTTGNQILDAKGGFFTLHKKHYYILAHFLWHRSSVHYKNDFRNEINSISEMFKRRLQRLRNLCDSHRHKFFIYYQQQPYNSVIINNKSFDLTNINLIKNQLNKSFGKNTLLCFSNFKNENKEGIEYFNYHEYDDFCLYASNFKKNFS